MARGIFRCCTRASLELWHRMGSRAHGHEGLVPRGMWDLSSQLQIESESLALEVESLVLDHQRSPSAAC